MSRSPVWIETLEGCSQRSLPEWLVYGVENNAGDRGSPQQGLERAVGDGWRPGITRAVCDFRMSVDGLERAVMDKRGCKD